MAKGDDPEKRRKIQAQTDEFAELLGIDPELVYFDSNGVCLTPTVADKVLTRLRTSNLPQISDILSDPELPS